MPKGYHDCQIYGALEETPCNLFCTCMGLWDRPDSESGMMEKIQTRVGRVIKKENQAVGNASGLGESYPVRSPTHLGDRALCL